MSNGQTISITLSPAQVDQVVRAAAQGSTPSFSALISTMNTRRSTAERAAEDQQAPDGQYLAEDQQAVDGQDRQAVDGGGGQDDDDGKGYFPVYEDARLSRSLLRGLSILTCFGPGHEERGILELAGQLGMSPSTTHRYVATLVELGLLERSTRSRKYRLAMTPAQTGSGAPAGEEVPAGQEVPAGTDMPAGEKVPAGQEVPTGAEMPAGEKVPAGKEVPTGAEMPAGEEAPVG